MPTPVLRSLAGVGFKCFASGLTNTQVLLHRPRAYKTLKVPLVRHGVWASMGLVVIENSCAAMSQCPVVAPELNLMEGRSMLLGLVAPQSHLPSTPNPKLGPE